MAGRIRVLGPVTVRATSGERMTLTRRREREVLALLVAGQGRSVSRDRLLAEVWGEAACGPAPLQVAVSRLRALLDPGGCGPRGITGTPAGYLLDLDRADVDAWVFEDLAEQALRESSPVDRLVLSSRAVDHWSGAPWMECRAPSLGAEATRLCELFVAVQESRAEALVEIGNPAAAARLLAPLAGEHPYREQLWVLLARARYACARQADALAALATLRMRLAEDLGVDPSPVVRETERAILTQDAAATPPAPARHGRIRTARRCRASGRARPAGVAGAAP